MAKRMTKKPTKRTRMGAQTVTMPIPPVVIAPGGEQALTKPQIISILTRSTHQVLESYCPVAVAAAMSDMDFFARLIAWSHVKGQIRDAKVALPLIALSIMKLDTDEGRLYAEHALAHLADLDPRTLAKGLF